MQTYSLTIPKNGTIVIPKDVRNLLKTNNITIQVDDENNVSIIPVKELKGRFSKYIENGKAILSNQEESEAAWNIHLQNEFKNNDK